MTDLKAMPRLGRRGQLGVAAAVLLALGAAGGAGAVSLTRPAIEMAPTVPTAIAELPATNGVVTAKGRVAEVYGDRFVIQDATGRAMVDAGQRGNSAVRAGQAVMVQGHFDDDQLRASYLIGADGQVDAVGPAGPPPHGPRRPGAHGHDGPSPPPPPGGPRLAPGDGAPPPPPPPAAGPGAAGGCAGADAAIPPTPPQPQS